jgi:hypothetical protein
MDQPTDAPLSSQEDIAPEVPENQQPPQSDSTNDAEDSILSSALAASANAEDPDYIPPAAFTASTTASTNPTAATSPICAEESVEQLLSFLSVSQPQDFSRRVATMTDVILKTLLERAGLKPFVTRQKNVELMKQWIGESLQRRPYFHQTKPQLIAICVNRFGESTRSYTKQGKEELIQLLASRHSHEPRVRENASTQPPQGRGSSNVAGNSMRIQLLTKIVESSTLPRLSAKGKEYCKTGHQLEIPLGKKLLKHSKENITIFQVEKLYRVGLVGKSDEMYAKASADFIGVACMEGVHALFAVECK